MRYERNLFKDSNNRVAHNWMIRFESVPADLAFMLAVWGDNRTVTVAQRGPQAAGPWSGRRGSNVRASRTARAMVVIGSGSLPTSRRQVTS